ncbi:MAG: glycogen/starch synthase, partial [Archangium sp.]|nr:glycogen/starch synthase [Archangium sp.]
MNVLFLSSEVAPWSKTGGLGDVAGALPKALALRGHRVRVVTPLYPDVKRGDLTRAGAPLGLRFPFGNVEVQAHVLRADGVEVQFIDAPSLFARERYYGFPDDARRFGAFSMAALTLAQRDGFHAEVVHANDWPTALTLYALRTGYAHTPLGKARRV